MGNLMNIVEGLDLLAGLGLGALELAADEVAKRCRPIVSVLQDPLGYYAALRESRILRIRDAEERASYFRMREQQEQSSYFL